MGEVISLIERLRAPPPKWAAVVMVGEDLDRPGEARAELSDFSGVDGFETPERCRRIGDALIGLAMRLSDAATALEVSQ